MDQRAKTGPFMDEDEFLPKRFVPKNLKKTDQNVRNQIRSATRPVPADDDMADRVWQAAWDLFRDVGYYNTDSHRIIEVSDAEIKEALYMANEPATGWARGKDARLWKHRQVEDTKPRRSASMSPDITVDEKYLHQSMCMAYLKEPLLDGLCGPILEDHLRSPDPVRPVPPRSAAAFSTSYNQKMAARLLGRPGILHGGRGHRRTRQRARSPCPTTSGGSRKPTPAWWVRLTEFKTADTLLNRALHYAQYGCFTAATSPEPFTAAGAAAPRAPP